MHMRLMYICSVTELLFHRCQGLQECLFYFTHGMVNVDLVYVVIICCIRNAFYIWGIELFFNNLKVLTF